jgi:D-amino-acid oxidase
MRDRRNFLKTAGLMGLMAGVSSCAGTTHLVRSEKYAVAGGPFIKPNFSLDRVIKETVGLRPFRTLGPRLETEKLGQKTIVHNYGHGGSGWSLSWGTGNIAAEMAAATGEKSFAILGCGVVGLTTARLLQRRGYAVNIYTKDLPPDVTSSKATGTWSPTYKLIEKENVTPAFVNMYQRASQFSFRMYQNLLGLNDIVQWVPTYGVSYGHREGAGHEQIPGLENNFVPQSQILDESPFDAPLVTKGVQLIFNIPSYLKFHMDEFLAFGGKINIRELKSLEAIDALPEKCVVNCTGLGSKALFNDTSLTPIRGQLSFLIPQPEIKYSIRTDGGYTIPRKDGMMIGATDNTIVGSWDTQPDPAQTERAVTALQEVMKGIRV